MKQKLTLTGSLIALLIIGLLNIQATQNSGQPPVGLTGAPGEGTCANCHAGGGLGSGSVILTVGSGVTTFTPGQTYTITVTTTDATKQRFGFSLSARSDGDSIGTYNLGGAANMGISNGFGANANVQYVSHRAASATNSWSFDWTAPLSGAQTVTFYVASVAANNNSNSSGDIVYTNSVSLQSDEDPSSRARSLQPLDLRLSPNPTQGLLRIQAQLPALQSAQLQILDITGRVVLTDQVSANGALDYRLNLEHLPAGIYNVQVTAPGYFGTQKLVVR
jgi:hypothetical protein